METIDSALRKSDRYRIMKPRQDQPTVTFEYKDGVKVELVPAYEDGITYSQGYWIPKDGRWELADYDYDAKYITQQNYLSDYWLIPTIKMLKAIKRNWFNEDVLSFHLLILAAKTTH